jgi:SAM-dependent MidA family methyltransferase
MSSFNSSLSLPSPPDELVGLSRQLCTSIVNEIERHGPLTFDRYMQMALYEPGLGYYVNGLHKFGQAGDFVTAPEQGELFARSLARQLDQVGSLLSDNWTLLELGAGSGALARDLLKSMLHPPARYLILDPSAVLREVQAETLAELPEHLRDRVAWLNAPPDQTFDGVIIANEVIDALPVRCFEITESGLLERAVTMTGGRLGWTTQAPSARLQAAVTELQTSLPSPLKPGYRSEICLDLPAWLKSVTAPLGRGLTLFIDYGYPRVEYYHPDRASGTLVCHYRHRAHFDPFVWPGLTDLSAFVDFSRVAEAGFDAGLAVAGFTSQAGFLLSLGAHEWLDRADDDIERLRLSAELKRLTLPGEMGEKFKVLGLARGFDQPLEGFELMSQLHRL